MEKLEKEFHETLGFYENGSISEKEFFNWVCSMIIFYGGKTPPEKDDEEINVKPNE
jgi:hypothetical protein